MQQLLSAEQIEAFYHDLFVEDQAQHFSEVSANLLTAEDRIVDVGGGCGFFARRLVQLVGQRVRVIDMDATSVAACHAAGIDADLGDALHPIIRDEDSVACFNLILHHLVSRSEAGTRALQVRALRAWHHRAKAVFVNEYIYESYFRDISGRLIFGITKSRLLSAIARAVARLVPTLMANTFGVGVRFRSHDEWIGLFRDAGFELVRWRQGSAEHIAAPRRLLLIKSIRRDSFLLRPIC